MANGWTPERRAKAAVAIRQWRPWEKSTGPRTAAGKARCARNPYKGGLRAELRRLARLLRDIEDFTPSDMDAGARAPGSRREQRQDGAPDGTAKSESSRRNVG